jgi:hypothetical protein
MSQEIVEEGVSTIELSQSAMMNKVFRVYDGRAKWFKDELGQIWVKFTTEDSGVRIDHVWPSNLVVEVCYIKDQPVDVHDP